ncbi:hypothetical protein [Arthrobacter sp. B1I2]|uniref:hypothetical protein n=1 Tax=Arthrobacter sp. B1I2 TaxID=3042263 RepID=UPI0027849533|nr:hypothetical protein [Arthrobacter sp. B1I2]MDQ0732428.1 hypothetical protein [Arthrobacter sp. B1I2]
MNEITGSPHFTVERSKAIEELLTKVAQDGTPENRSFQHTKGKKILLSGVAVALAVSGAAIALQQPATDKSSVACCAAAEPPNNAAANSHDAYATIPSDEIQQTETASDFIWDLKDPYYGFNTVPVVARVHIDSIDGGRTYSPIFDQYTFPQTIGKMTIQTVYKGDVKPGAQLTYNKGGGIVSFDEYWKSLNPQQQDKFTNLNGGQKPTGIEYVKKMYSEDAEIKVGKDYIALLLPQQYRDGTAEEYSIQGFQYGFREVRGSGTGTTVLNNVTKEWEGLGSIVP